MFGIPILTVAFLQDNLGDRTEQKKTDLLNHLDGCLWIY